MKRLSGKPLRLTLLALIALFSITARAEVTATLDRDRAAMGDTLRLTITATESNEDVSNTDLRPLQANFEILQRSTRSSTNITNGQRSHRRELLLDITPKRQGILDIPPMRVGQKATRLLQVSVGPPPNLDTGNATVLFEAELDRSSVYVQGQVILTLRLQQAINLESRSISELQLDNAFVVPLEQNSFQRTVDGRPWLVHEVRYAIFPELSGQLEIPAQSFSARESIPRRSLFEMGGGGRLLRMTSEPLSIEVLPRPDGFPGTTWLPARNLTLEENWSTPPEQLRTGESATRTIRIRGEGLQGAQLPPILFPATEGVKYYPDQPSISDMEVGTGLLGSRQDSVALVPTRTGTLEIPEIRIPWWDIEAGVLRYAVLPGRQLTVAPGDTTTNSPPFPATAAELSLPATPSPVTGGENTSRYWQWLALFSSAGWLLTLAWLFIKGRGQQQENATQQQKNIPEQKAYKQLLAACASDSAQRARQSLVQWAAALTGNSGIVGVADAEQALRDSAISSALAEMNSALYSSEGGQWRGEHLAEAVRRARKEYQSRPATTPELQLYPA